VYTGFAMTVRFLSPASGGTIKKSGRVQKKPPLCMSKQGYRTKVMIHNSCVLANSGTDGWKKVESCDPNIL
jgi:hypothetical protein